MRAILLLGLLSSACATWHKPTAVDWVSLAAAETSIALDAAQTFDIKRHPRIRESNPLLGAHPTDRRVAIHMLGAGLLTGGLWISLPTPYRSVFAGAIIAVEADAIGTNAALGLRVGF